MALKNEKKIPVGLVGANGYSGLQLARLLLQHPYASLAGCFTRDSSWTLAQELMDEGACDVSSFRLDDLPGLCRNFETVFLATPPEVSQKLVPLLRHQQIRVIDLSGAFRLEKEIFEQAYDIPHEASEWIGSAQYGLMPWANLTESDSLIANPGCYATSVLMALLPFFKKRLVNPNSIVIEGKSGASGAGRKAKENLLFTEVEGNVLPYRVGKHQHIPEIINYLKIFSGAEVGMHFSTSLIPVRRGLISSIYATLTSDWSRVPDDEVLLLIDQAFAEAYSNYSLLKYGRIRFGQQLLSLRRVVGTCRTHVSYSVVEGRVYIFSCIDNLLKGAASQAIENWNRMHGYPVETGLTRSEEIL